MREFVTPDSSRDFDAWVDLLSGAFLNDPLMMWLTPDPATRERKLRAFFSAELRWLLRDSIFDVLHNGDGELLGIGIWRAPDAPEPSAWHKIRYSWAISRALGSQYLRRVKEMGLKFHEVTPKEPHWYLAYVAASPITAGEGVGKSLILRGLERSHESGIGVFLESSNQTNDAYYRKFGFRDAATVSFSNGPTCTTMWRDAV